MPSSKCQTSLGPKNSNIFQSNVTKLKVRWVYLPLLPLNDCRGEIGRRIEWSEERKTERKKGQWWQHSMQCLSDLLQPCYSSWILSSAPEINLIGIWFWRGKNTRKTHAYTLSHSQPYEIDLFEAACNLEHIEGKLCRLRVGAQHNRKKERRQGS